MDTHLRKLSCITGLVFVLFSVFSVPGLAEAQARKTPQDPALSPTSEDAAEAWQVEHEATVVRCTKALSESPLAQPRFDLLLERCKALVALSRTEEATNDALELWVDFAHALDESGRRYALADLLNQEGFHLESWLLLFGAAQSKGIVEELQLARSAEQVSETLDASYAIAPAQVLQHFSSAGGEVPVGDSGTPLFLSRVLAYAIYDVNLKLAAETSDRLEKAVVDFCNSDSREIPLETLAHILNVLADQAALVHWPELASSVIGRTRLDGGSRMNEMLTTLSDTQMLLYRTFFQEPLTLPEFEYVGLVSRWAKKCEERGDYYGAVDAYDALVRKFPDHDQVNLFLRSLIDIHDHELEQPHLGSRYASILIQRSPDSAYAAQCTVRLAQESLSAGQIEEAYEFLNTRFGSDMPSSYREYVPHAQLLLAQCESAMSLTGLRDDRVADLAESFPDSIVTGHAMLWLALKLSDERSYPEATELLTRILREYPSTELSTTARKHLEALQSINRVRD